MTSTSLFEQKILNELCESNFQQLIKTQDGRSLDVLLCNKPQYLTSIVIDNHLRSLFNSDHKPYQAKVSFDIRPVHISSPSPKQKLDFGIFAYKKANWKEINEFILQHPFRPYCMSNVDLMVELWYKWLHEILKDLLSITTKHRSELAPWVSGNSSNLIKKLKTLQLKQQRQPTPSNKIKIECLQTELTLSLQNDQHLHEKALFKEGKFSDIQRYLKSLTKSNTNPSEIFFDQRTANTDIEKVILFNEYFQSVFTQNTYSTKIGEQNSTLLNQIHFTTDEIENALQLLDVNKAKGPDKIGNLLLKSLSKSLPKSLHLLFNLIANKARFPEKWKVSEIAPILKDGDKQDVSNYRPISLLSTVSKLLEKLIFEKLTPIVYPTLASAQHGFRPKRSTITNLIEYLHEIYSCLESENCSYLNIFYIDFEKAFDKVTHELLIQKLAALGIGGNCLNLLRSYLYKRKQTVRLNDTVSDELEVFSGVPQGSILGPLFFLVLSCPNRSVMLMTTKL